MKFASLVRFVAAAALLVAVVGCAESTDPIVDTTTPVVEDTTTPPADAPIGTDPTTTDSVPADPVVTE